MENNQELSLEMAEMKDQVALLKSKLDEELTINDKLLRKVISQKANAINRTAWTSVYASIFVIIVALLFFPFLGLSWYFIGATILMMLVCDFYTWKYHKNVNSKTLNGDLLTVAKTMKELKMAYGCWLKYAFILVAVWMIWYALELYFISDSWKIAFVQILSILIGCTIGGVIGYRMHKKVVNTADEIINQIEE